MTAPYEFTRDEVQILKAAWASDAGRMALDVIAGRLCQLHGASFNTDALVMAHNEGRRYVGRAIMAAVQLPLEKIVREPDEPRSSRPVTASERVEQRAADQQRTAAAGAVAAARERAKQR